MKKITITLLLLLAVLTMTAQTQTVDLSNMTEDITLGADNCGANNTQVQYITTGDVNLNDYHLYLRHVTLDIMGNLTGPGHLHGCNASVYVQGFIDTDEHVHPDHLPNYIHIQHGIDMSSDPLKTVDYLLSAQYTYTNKVLVFKFSGRIVVYNLLSQVLIDKVSDTIDLSQLSDVIVIIRTEKGSMKLLR